MARGLTNFARLTDDQKLVWSRETWQQARDNSFVNRFVGTGQNAVIQRITELTKTERGEEVIMHLVADLVGDGVVGDNEREGMEEEIMAYSDKVSIDLISNQVRQKGKLANQKTVINFREISRDKLANWLSTRIDQLTILTASGIPYTKNCDGSDRTDSAFSTLSFAADVSAPTANRHFRVTTAAGAYVGLEAGATASVAATDTLSYQAIVDALTATNRHYVKPVVANGREYHVGLISLEGLAQLKKDPEFQAAVVQGMPRGPENPFFSGAVVTVDGLVLHPHRLTYNTLGAASGSKWGATGTVDGSRMLILGAQAIGMADLGEPEWAEKWFNYNSSPGISVDKMFGLLKPKFYSVYDKAEEDFGVVALDHAI